MTRYKFRIRLLRLLALVALALLAPAASAKSALFRNVNLVPMERQRVVRGQSVLVRNGQIEAIGKRLAPTRDTEIIEGHGRLWLTPGLADLHVHSDTREDLSLYLASGITAIANMGDARASFVGRTSPAAARGEIPGPLVFNAFVVDGSPQYGHFTISTPKEARSVVGLAKTNRYNFIKVYNNLAPGVWTALADEAARQRMPIVGHGITSVGLRSQLAQGQVLIAHAEELFYTFFSSPGSAQTDEPPSEARIAEAVALVRAHGTAVGADLITYGSIMRVIGRKDMLASCLRSPHAAYLSPADRLAWQRSGYVNKSADLRAKYVFLQKLIKAMADRDVQLLSGSDAPTIPCVAPGTSLHDNLAALETAGLTRFQALSTATRLPGEFIQRTLGGPRFGIIKTGSRADFVLSNANPLDNLDTLRQPVGVMVGGKWYDRAALAAMKEDVRKSYAYHGGQ